MNITTADIKVHFASYAHTTNLVLLLNNLRVLSSSTLFPFLALDSVEAVEHMYQRVKQARRPSNL